MAPFAPLFGPAIFSPSQAPASLPSIFELLFSDFWIRRAGLGECSQTKLGKSHQFLVGENSQPAPRKAISGDFLRLARPLNSIGYRSRRTIRRTKKGRIQMSAQ